MTDRRTDRRHDALSRARIVDAAIELLDAAGDAGLTFRALAARLATGPGAIYWHVANKQQLLDAATDAVLADLASGEAQDGTPQEVVRAVALILFDAIDAHPWVSPQLTRNPWQPAMLRVIERIGRQLDRIGVRPDDRFAVVTALLNYVLGVGAQNAANARGYDGALGDRAAFLRAAAAVWERLDEAQYPFLHAIAPQMRDHDDRAQFLAGVDLILAGAAR